MNEEPTKNLPSPSFEERVLAELAAMRGELTAIRGDLGRLDSRLTTLEERFDRLEEKVERRLQETRPIWEDVQMRVSKLDSKFDFLIDDVNEVRYQQRMLTRRVEQVERARTE